MAISGVDKRGAAVFGTSAVLSPPSPKGRLARNPRAPAEVNSAFANAKRGVAIFVTRATLSAPVAAIAIALLFVTTSAVAQPS